MMGLVGRLTEVDGRKRVKTNACKNATSNSRQYMKIMNAVENMPMP